MSSEEVKRVSRQDIQLVQNLIERCLQLYMNQKEVVNTLQTQAKIAPGFTELVWQKLEEENREFFKAYHVRLMVKNQIILFNQLLEKQVQLMHEIGSTGIAPPSFPNGSNSASMHQVPFCYGSTSRPEYTNGSVLPAGIMNGGVSSHHGLQIGPDSSLGSGRIDISTSMLPTQNQNMHVGVLPGMNGTMKLEPGYSNNSDFPFCADNTFLDERPPMGDVQASPFSGGPGGELNAQPISEPLLDTDTFGFLSHIPRNFSFSDLADQFNPDILESFGKSPFLAPESNNFSGSPRRDCEGESKKLDTITEGAAFD